ncbi:chalcone isomerase family protein [Pseudoalteromonas sp. A25]|uniref:chalcone isomerase family protein n=1 Tax=Pseudoalteromonas sp. A25 TaxID=116092 RepID=UPI001260E67E|nr:chalcone isomerase family protein [Pseudoalteromonas sp. A25]
MKLILFLLSWLFFIAPTVHASIAQKLLPTSAPVGASPTLTYLFWDVYQATLYAPNGQYSADQPFVLKLHYLRELKGKDIAQRSVEEMKKQGVQNQAKLTQWQTQMQSIFPDVTNGTELYGKRTNSGTSKFYRGEDLIGEINDPQFTQHFFAIWLGEKTSEPDMRKALLNNK